MSPRSDVFVAAADDQSRALVEKRARDGEPEPRLAPRDDCRSALERARQVSLLPARWTYASCGARRLVGRSSHRQRPSPASVVQDTFAARIWRIGPLGQMPRRERCPLCESPVTPVGTKLGDTSGLRFQVARCRACRFAFVADPWVDFDRIYSEEYYAGQGADPLVSYAYEDRHPDTTDPYVRVAGSGRASQQPHHAATRDDLAGLRMRHRRPRSASASERLAKRRRERTRSQSGAARRSGVFRFSLRTTSTVRGDDSTS